MDYGQSWAIILLPLISFVVLALFGRQLSKPMVGGIALVPLVLSFVVGAILTLKLSGEGGGQHIVQGPEWIKLLSFRAPFELIIDPLSLTMTLIVTGIGSLIFLYSTGYMAEEQDYSRFFAYLSLFVTAMLVLVLGNNLILLFVGWEGVGLCSYLLIGFWYKDLANAKAANKAFIVNRIGDWGLTLGLFLLFMVLVTSESSVAGARYFSYDQMLPAIEHALKANPAMADAIALLLFVGACGKSAQFPLYFWLPDAMAGPTPVSALIHAATMVTSGVVLLNRMHIVFELAPLASAIVLAIGSFTAIFAALIAFGQTDIKKVLAFSTVSQLGYMFIACGAGAYWVGMFHVTTHAFFKALLFLGSGAVIHAMSHNQDMRNYGKLAKYLPVTCATMVIGGLAIAGIPPLAGYYSKEAILHAAFGSSNAAVPGGIAGVQIGVIAGWVALITAMLTAWYMTRLTFLTFFGNKERWREFAVVGHAGSESEAPDIDALSHVSTGHDHDGFLDSGERDPDSDHDNAVQPFDDPHGFYYPVGQVAEHEPHDDAHGHELSRDHHPKEVPISMLLPLVALAALSIGGGFLLNREDVFQNWLYPHGLTVLHAPVESPLPITALALGAAVLGLILGFVFYRNGLPAREGWDESQWNPFRRLAGAQFGYDRLVSVGGVEGAADLALGAWKGIEAWVIDGVVLGASWLAEATGAVLARLQSGYVRFYALVFVGGVVCVLAYATFVIGQGVTR